MKIYLRNVVEADFEALAGVHKKSIRELCGAHYTTAQIESWTGILEPGIYDQALQEKVFIVARDGQGILGFGMLDLKKAEVSAVYLSPEAIGRGLGRRVLEELEQTAARKGLVYLTVYATLNAIGFYRHHGYKPIEDTFHVLPDNTRLECVKMEKRLAAVKG